MLKGNTLINNSKSDAVRIDGDVNCEAGKDSHQDFVSTPRTEASTPESGGEYSIGSRGRSNSEKSVDDNFRERSLQRQMTTFSSLIEMVIWTRLQGLNPCFRKSLLLSTTMTKTKI